MGREKFSLNSTEFYYPGKPLSIDQLEGTPHLKALAQALREITVSRKLHRDIVYLNNLDYFNFISALNNYIFYLRFHGQYSLLEELFKGPELKADWIAFLNNSMDENRRIAFQSQIASLLIKKSTEVISRPVSQEYSNRFAWTHPDPALSNIEKYQHYVRELDRITAVYHTHRTRINSAFIGSNLNRINVLCNALASDPRYQARVSRLQKQADDWERQLQIIAATPHGGDVQAMRHQAEQIESVAKKIQHAFGSFLGEADPNHHLLKKVGKEFKSAVSECKHENTRVTEEFRVAEREIMGQINESRALAKKDKLGQLDKIAKVMDKYSLDSSQLTKSMEQLNNAHDSASFASSLELCQSELQTIELTAARQLPEETYRAFKAEVDELSKLAFAGLPQLVQPDHVPSPPARDELQRFHSDIHERDLLPETPTEKMTYEELAAIEQIEEKLIAAVEVRDQRLVEVQPHLESTRQVTKTDIEQSMRASIKLLGECTEGISKSQQIEFQSSLEKMKEHHDALTQTYDDKKMQQLVTSFSAELVRLMPMAKPVLAPEKYQELVDKNNILTRFNQILSDQFVDLDPSRLNDLAVQSVNGYIVENEFSSMNFADSLSEEQPRSGQDEEPSASNEAEATDFNPDEQGEKPVTPSENKKEIVNQEKINGGKIAAMKKAMSVLRAAESASVDNPALALEDKEPAAEEEQAVMLDKENQAELKQTLIRVVKILDIANDNENLSLEDKERISTSKNLSAEILSSLNEEVSITKLESLQESLLLLQPNTPQLNKFIETIESVMESIADDTPRPGNT